MLRIPLSDDRDVLIDDADLLMISGFPWRILEVKGLLYAHALNGKMSLLMHRLIIGAGPREHVDHWNNWGLDNQKQNLRIVTRSQNQANRGCHSKKGRTSQYKGVSWDKSRNKWGAFYTAPGGIHRGLGRFDDEEVAARAYDKAMFEAWGVFARLNFPVDNGAICAVHRLGILAAPCVCTA